MKEYHLTFKEYQSIELSNGKYVVENYAIFYYENGLFHRLDGPAVEKYSGELYNGYKAWQSS